TELWATKVQNDGVLEVTGEPRARPLLRPWTMELEPIDAAANQSANARPRWTTDIRARSKAFAVALPASTGAAAVIEAVGFHTHAVGNEVEVARGVTSVVADIDEVEVDIALVRGGTPVGLGFVAAVDAVRIRVRRDGMPSFADMRPEAQRALRTSWFTRS